MDLDSLGLHHLSAPRDVPLLARMKEFDEIASRWSWKEIISKIAHLAGYLDDLVDLLEKHDEPLALEGIRFTCNDCGRCCSNLQIGVSLGDVKNYLAGQNYLVLACTTLDLQRPYLRFYSKHEFRLKKHVASPAFLDQMEKINPTLFQEDRKRMVETASHCMFYNDDEMRCTIYNDRPLECKLYPVANIIFGVKNRLCDAKCFLDGDSIDTGLLGRDLREKKIHDVAHHALFTLNPAGGWRVRFYKLVLLLDYLFGVYG